MLSNNLPPLNAHNPAEEVRFAIVNPADGDIIRIGTCSRQSLHLQTEESFESVYPVPENVGDLTHFWNGEDFIEYPEPQPSRHHRWIEGAWLDPRTPGDHAAELEASRSEASRQINNFIGHIRTKFVTVIPAQDMVYQAKEAEAKAYLTDPAPVEADYPFIHAEIGITGDSAWQVAQVYANQALILRQTAAQLETVRLGHIAMIEAATDDEAIDLALTQFHAALNS